MKMFSNIGARVKSAESDGTELKFDQALHNLSPALVAQSNAHPTGDQETPLVSATFFCRD